MSLSSIFPPKLQINLTMKCHRWNNPKMPRMQYFLYCYWYNRLEHFQIFAYEIFILIWTAWYLFFFLSSRAYWESGCYVIFPNRKISMTKADNLAPCCVKKLIAEAGKCQDWSTQLAHTFTSSYWLLSLLWGACDSSKGAWRGTEVHNGWCGAETSYFALNRLQTAKGKSRSPGQVKEHLCLRTHLEKLC